MYEPEFLSPQEETSLIGAIGRLDLQEARYKEYTAKRRIASFEPGQALPDFLRPLQRHLAGELAPRSAYTLRGDARWRWQHSTAPAKALRYSITFRTLAA